MAMTEEAGRTAAQDEREQEPHLSGPKVCSCEWRTVDGGNLFHDVRIPNKSCPVHGRR